MNTLIVQLHRDYPALVFKGGNFFRWSPKNNEIVYDKARLNTRSGSWSLLHEVGHALCKHSSYDSDFELVKLESDAWEKARKIGHKYNIEIDDEHVQDCMDTYRDWLHQRSACPRCNTRSLQQDSRTYRCYNCGQVWRVTSSRFCRPYRLTKQTKTSHSNSKAMFQ